ncbi:MAG: hypothetical protein AABM40_15520, partial [Chloroflexota bacterium]
GLPACDGCVVQDGTISSCLVGVNLDGGTARTTVQRVRFLAQRIAAIDNYQGVSNTFTTNDYGGILSGAATITTNAPPSVAFTCP